MSVNWATLQLFETKNAWNFIWIIFDKANVYLSRRVGPVIYENSLFQNGSWKYFLHREPTSFKIGFKLIWIGDDSADESAVLTRVMFTPRSELIYPYRYMSRFFDSVLDYYWNTNTRAMTNYWNIYISFWCQ